MKKKNLYGTFLKISIPILIIILIGCNLLKVNQDIFGNICAIYMLLAFGMLLICGLIVEPKEDYELTKDNIEKAEYEDEPLDSFIDKLLSDLKLKKIYKKLNLFAPIYILPFSIIVSNILRIVCTNVFHNNYRIEMFEKYVVIFLIILPLYSFYLWLKRKSKIRDYLLDGIFNYFTNNYKMVETANDDGVRANNYKLTEKISDTYSTRTKIKIESSTDRIYKDEDDSLEKRIFLLHITYGDHGDTLFYGLSILFLNVKNRIFYKTQNYNDKVKEVDKDYFNNPFESDMNNQLEEELEKIQKKYSKDFKISTVTGNIQIFCEQNLTISTHHSRMKVYVRDFCNAMSCLFELSKAIENDYKR